MSQQQRILNALWDGDWVCSEWMYRNALPNGRNRIGELRRAGYDIESEPCPDTHGPGYFRYRLHRVPVQARLAGIA
jgi:hypothetical protein